MDRKLLLIILDGVPWRNWRRLFGNLEGWVDSGEARVWKHRSVLPSVSASCYASIHTGVTPQVHGCTGNGNVFRIKQPDIFSQVRKAGGRTGAVAHSFWSEFFNRAPFDPVRGQVLKHRNGLRQGDEHEQRGVHTGHDPHGAVLPVANG